jgi:hypothetical protein
MPGGHFAAYEELSDVCERPMITRMMTTARAQHRCDRRLRDLVRRTGDVTIATDLGVPRSTARGWLGAAPTVVVSLEVADLTEPELRQQASMAGSRELGAPSAAGHVSTLAIQAGGALGGPAVLGGPPAGVTGLGVRR